MNSIKHFAKRPYMTEMKNTLFPFRMQGRKCPLYDASNLYQSGHVINIKLRKPSTSVISVQFSSVAQLCPPLCDPMDSSMPALPVHHELPELHIYPNSCALNRWCRSTISSSVIPFSSCPQSFPASGSFQLSQPFASGGQSIGVKIKHYIQQLSDRA